MYEPIERDVAHRPFPLPRAPWVMFQSWRTLLFAHWPLPHEVLRPLVPEQLVLEEFNGSAWIGLTPFRVAELHLRLLPPLLGLSSFPEMNLRTYVQFGGTPGIFFFSLDAGNLLAVLGARLGYRLPYHDAEMLIEQRGDWFEYRSRRRDDSGAEFIGRYRPVGAVFQAQPGTLEHFLTERYTLYTVLRSGRILRGHIHHRPWSLQHAEAEIERNTVAASRGITLPERAPLLHFSRRQDTLIWPPMPAA
jgi:uncharacterized protein YqjF (DUF2071 family)